jgi:AcrR family transcriptional regulator
LKGRGRPNGSDSAETRDAILQSARRLFAEKGFEATSMALVAQGAGLSASAAYYYYPHKFAVYEAVFMESLQSVWGPINEAIDASTTFSQALTAFFTAGSGTEDESYLQEFLASVSLELIRIPRLAVLLERRAEEQLAVFRKIVDIAIMSDELRCSVSSRDELAELLRAVVVGWAMEYVNEPGLRVERLPDLIRLLKPGLAQFDPSRPKPGEQDASKEQLNSFR